ncbi:PDC sensor domain-containing protein [Psychromonas sp. Urea-02u-13]|uniref:PDC sensor domain-containing protein n=1 Tax=Psychromonas sp. Urea-02u-13 TaxID=2058326 RepID=UPI0012FEF7D6|nr:PDC sensor domain-containing protein [Psychromonas sp. Urea-02u-13]
MFNSHISSAFFQFDTMLGLISYEYFFKDDLKIDVIGKILLSNPLLLGVALFNVDGSLKHSSRNLNSINFPNLRTNKKTGQWFEKTLNQAQMTIGRPYYLPALKKWVIPVRKRVTNIQGQVVGVITSGLDLKTLLVQWDGSKNSKRILQATLDRSFYPVLRTMTPQIDYRETYSTAITPELIKDLKIQLALQKITLEELRKSGGIIQLRTGQERGRYASILFNRKLDVWISATEANSTLKEKMISQTIIYGTFYLLFLVIIFFLFKWIVRIEKTKIAVLTYRAEHDLLTGLYNRSILKI